MPCLSLYNLICNSAFSPCFTHPRSYTNITKKLILLTSICKHHNVTCLLSYINYYSALYIIILIVSFFLYIQINGANSDCSVRLENDLHLSTMICLLSVYKELNHILIWGFPNSSVGKESACNAGVPSSIPG